MIEFKRLVLMEEDYRELPHRASMSREVWETGPPGPMPWIRQGV